MAWITGNGLVIRNVWRKFCWNKSCKLLLNFFQLCYGIVFFSFTYGVVLSSVHVWFVTGFHTLVVRYCFCRPRVQCFIFAFWHGVLFHYAVVVRELGSDLLLLSGRTHDWIFVLPFFCLICHGQGNLNLLNLDLKRNHIPIVKSKAVSWGRG